jgi:meso-butanediol dehydrogenase / (S,S)-butanediol dehydrogenase / diacetyl reductase
VAEQRFSGKVVLVTGAARGIGRGIALRFAAEGADVAVSDKLEAVNETAEMVRARGRKALAFVADVTNKAQVTEMYAETERKLGRLDISVQNAGVITIHPLDEMPENEWDLVMDVNTKGTFLCAQAAAAIMKRHGGGRIINAASGQARQGFIYTPHYAASKFGVVGLTQSLAKELAKDRITVNAFCPGIIDTEMWAYNDREWGKLLGSYGKGELMAEWVADIPMGRVGTPDDVADLVLFLASDAAGYITGQTINIDGGMFMN